MAHYERHGGLGAMDVDHHNPTLSDATKNNYNNLFLTTRHCNGKKSNNWPSTEQQKLGIRFLNPCEEIDYGVHIFEDPDTFEVWGETPPGRYHIRILDLNAPHLVKERRIRHIFRSLYGEPSRVELVGNPPDPAAALNGIKAFVEEFEMMIPPILQKKKPAIGG
jgi:hypothetical protein